jgi:hypothetical protein
MRVGWVLIGFATVVAAWYLVGPTGHRYRAVPALVVGLAALVQATVLSGRARACHQ